MSEYGLKIKNIEAASLYYYNLGLRNNYDCKPAMLNNSLFLDFLLENGLDTHKGESTRDVICLEFNYGTRSYDEEVKHLNKQLRKCWEDDTVSKLHKARRILKIHELLRFADKNKSRYQKINKDDIRLMYYTHGVDVSYPTYNKRGKIIDSKTIHYKMLYRTPGKAKKGSCIFINEELYDKAHNFLWMGIELPKENAPIVEIGAYSSLITSSIVGRIQILPENILVVKDVDSFFKTKVVSIETDQAKHCQAVRRDDYKVKNTLFDGQALIDTSIFPEWATGYILLRHHFCKMAAFHSKIQAFFADYYGDKYLTATVKDMFGNEHYVKDIKLITTENALKWLKFNVSYDRWLEEIGKNGYRFGIVKTAHKSKLGEVQRMSYQMINSLDINIMDDVMRDSIEYVESLKKNDDVFLAYLRDNSNFSNDFDVLLALVEQDRDFLRSDYFRARKKKIINTYVLNMKSGKVLQNADNLVIVGSPYAMLLRAVGKDPETDETFQMEDGAIQCFTNRFKFGDYLACFRNPFNGRENLGILHNVHHPYFDKYFDFGELIIAVNLVHTDFQSRNNGADQDSDSIYCTNQPNIVEFARYCYANYPTIVNNVPQEKNIYSNDLKSFAIIDSNLAAAQRAIGESSNLAQICLTYTYNFDDSKYEDYVCILSCIAQISIDNCKRKYDINLVSEINRIRMDMDIDEYGYPAFWMLIRRGFNPARINKNLVCPMNYIYNINIGRFPATTSTLPMSTFFIKIPNKAFRKRSKKVEALIEKYSLRLYEFNTGEDTTDAEEYLLLRNDFDDLIKDIRQTYISTNYLGLMSWLIDRAFMVTPNIQRNTRTIVTTLNKNKSILLKTLYEVNKKSLLKCFSRNIGGTPESINTKHDSNYAELLAG